MSYADNPRADKPSPSQAPQESTGPVTSDSLAAESLRSGGGFAENENAAALDVRGSDSTFNTTDTSGATALHPARDGSSREDQDALGLGSDERGHTGIKYPDGDQPQYEGVHSQEGYVGGAQSTGGGYTTSAGGKYSGATGDSFADGGSGLTGSSGPDPSQISSGGRTAYRSQEGGNYPIATGGAGEDFGTASRPEADIAPNYAATVSGGIRSEGELKPKGQNLTEGGIPQTKTFTGNVGGANDPGRLAEQTFTKNDSEDLVAAGATQYRGSGQDSSTGGQYDVLESERAPDRNY